MRRTRRGFLVLLLALLGAALATVAGSVAAGAHAVVVSSSPSADERLSAPPTEVSIVFSETITSDLGGLTVLDSSGERVDNDDSSQPTPQTLRASVRPDLGDGTYIANYKIVSGDGHPISGAVVFGVGNAQLGDLSDLAAANDPATERLAELARLLTYTAALLAAGLAFFVVFVHDGARDRRRMANVVQVATVVAGLGALLTIAAQGALATGDGFGAATDVEVAQGVLREGLGWASAVLLIGLALCHVAVTTRPSALAQALTFYGGLAVTTSFVFWGHALEAPNPWLAIAANAVHVAVAALWFGGLVGLTMALRARSRAARDAGLPEPTLLGRAPGGSGGPPTDRARRDATDPGPGQAQGASGTTRTATALLDRPDDSTSGSDLDGPADETDRSDGTRGPVGRDGQGGSPRAEGSERPKRPQPGSLAATVAMVRRFSTIAAVALAVLAVTGATLGWGELGSFGALTATEYGLTLLVKLAIVAVIVFLAAYNRFLLLPWLLADNTAETSDDDFDAKAPEKREAPSATQVDEGLEAGWRTLRRTVAAEALAIVAVLAVTAVLVNVVPGRAAVIPTGPFNESQPFRDGTVALTVTPNQTGINSFHVDFLGTDGRPADLAQKVTLELSLPDKDIGPLQREMVKAGTGHFILEGISDVSIAGTWDLGLTIRVSDFDQERVTFTDTIG